MKRRPAGLVHEGNRFSRVDPRRSRDAANRALSPSVVRGFFTLSLAPKVISEVLKIRHAHGGLNYGLNRVRFLAPVRAGSRIRGSVSVRSAEQRGIGLLSIFGITFENEGYQQPACEADAIALYP